MDLKELDAWTLQALEHEARRRGIIDAELRSRGELIRLILQSSYSRVVSQGARRIARGFKGLDAARDMLSVAIETAAELSARLPGRTGKTLVGMPSPAPTAAQAPAPAVKVRWRGGEEESGAGAKPTATTTTTTTTTTSASATTGLEPAPAAVVEQRSAAVELVRGPSVAERVGGREPAPMRVVREPGTHSFVDEPIRTHSMARLLAAQGHLERAIAIYEELMAQNSEAAGVRDELQALRNGQVPAHLAARLPEPPAVTLPDTGDRLCCERAGDDGLELSWTISDAGQARARAVLGDDGELTVRLVRICPDAERVVRSEITEHGPVAPNGRWQTAGATPGERWVAAVGLRTGSRFVSITHAR